LFIVERDLIFASQAAFMDIKRKDSKLRNNNPQGNRLRGRQKKTDSRTVYKRILIDAKIRKWNER
jgi:hypothetical protein